MVLVVGRRHQDADVPADNLRLRIPEQSLRTAVERLDAALGVDDDDAVDGRVEDGIQPLRTGHCRIRQRSLRRLGCLQPVTQPGNGQAGGDEHAERQLVRDAFDGKAVWRQQEDTSPRVPPSSSRGRPAQGRRTTTRGSPQGRTADTEHPDRAFRASCSETAAKRRGRQPQPHSQPMPGGACVDEFPIGIDGVRKPTRVPAVTIPEEGAASISPFDPASAENRKASESSLCGIPAATAE